MLTDRNRERKIGRAIKYCKGPGKLIDQREDIADLEDWGFSELYNR